MAWSEAHLSRSTKTEGQGLGERGWRPEPVSEWPLHRLTGENGPFSGEVPSLVEEQRQLHVAGVNAGQDCCDSIPELDKVAANRACPGRVRAVAYVGRLAGAIYGSAEPPAAVRAGDGKLCLATRSGVS